MINFNEEEMEDIEEASEYVKEWILKTFLAGLSFSKDIREHARTSSAFYHGILLAMHTILISMPEEQMQEEARRHACKLMMGEFDPLE